MVAVRIGDHALHHARARDAIGVVTIAEIGVAEEPAHAEAAIGADLPAVAADTCVARAELGLGPAVIASHPDQSARHSIFGANRTPNTADFERAVGVTPGHVMRQRVAEHIQSQPLGHVAVAVQVCSARQRPPPMAGDVQTHVGRRLQRQWRGELPRDIFADDREPVRGQVQQVAVKEISVRADHTGRRGGCSRLERGADQVLNSVRTRVRFDVVQDRGEVEIMDDRSAACVAGEDLLRAAVVGRRKGGPDCRSGSVARYFGQLTGIAGEEADGRRAVLHHQVHILLECSHRGARRGRRAGERAAAKLVVTRVVAAD